MQFEFKNGIKNLSQEDSLRSKENWESIRKLQTSWEISSLTNLSNGIILINIQGGDSTTY
ncbi:MAG: hypothetical protein EAX86_12870 [Candidatus Heimdallarchaeota archaeon]|nr:hypothetical protein [Candidatus Heimdallarchaeota archaeon]